MNNALFNHILILCFGAFLLITPSGVLGEEEFDPTATHILEQLQKKEFNYPQQKIFVHLDKEEYLAGERIWMKIFLVNGATHRPDTLSTNLYVELISADGELASLELMRMENGFSYGDIALPDSISEGNYMLRAYTDWMNNFDEKFFFKKDIYVYNAIEENYLRRRDVWQNRFYNRRLSREQEEMQFAFFPEGGHLVAGLENRVAFKAANALGAGVEAEGHIRDGDGTKIVAFSTNHQGMGDFSFTPDPDERYSAKIKFASGETSTKRLPEAESMGFLLAADQHDDQVDVRVEANFDPVNTELTNAIYVLAQTRGRAYFLEEAKLEDQQFRVQIPKSTFPSGITQIQLFNAQGLPVAERLVFINHGDIEGLDYLEHDVGTDDDGEERIKLGMALSNDENAGSYSLAVLDTDEESPDHRTNIASELLIFSDLGMAVKDPAYYLGQDEDAARAADLLMMTQGWRRFDWHLLLADEFPEIEYGFPTGISIGGQVSPRSSDRETGEVDVELAVQKEEVNIYTTTTDRRGNFLFANLDYDGYIMATLRVEQPLDKRALRVDLASRDLDEPEYEKNFNTRKKQVTSRGDDWERVSQPETVMRSRGLLEPSRETVSIYRDADQVIYFDDIRDQHRDIMDVLRTRVRGLRVVGSEIMLRGPSTFRGTNEPVFMVDEVMVDRNSFLNVSIQEVDRLAVISGPQSAILGSRGANGALLIYTRRGDAHRHESYEYLLKGFHEPAETFEAKINTDRYADSQMDRTLFWKPVTETNEYGEIDVSFPTDEHVRNLRVIIQGIDENGRITFDDQVIQTQ